MNKKRTITLVLAALFVTSIFTSSVFACEEPPVGDQGCTPGFWKNHTDQWQVYGPTDLVPGTNTTFIDALQARGKGSQVLRHGAAAWLNYAHDGVWYSLKDWEIEGADGDTLEQANESFCPLGGRAVKWSPGPVVPES
jgi:hypothetical protein